MLLDLSEEAPLQSVLDPTNGYRKTLQGDPRYNFSLYVA